MPTALLVALLFFFASATFSVADLVAIHDDHAAGEVELASLASLHELISTATERCETSSSRKEAESLFSPKIDCGISCDRAAWSSLVDVRQRQLFSNAAPPQPLPVRATPVSPRPPPFLA